MLLDGVTCHEQIGKRGATDHPGDPTGGTASVRERADTLDLTGLLSHRDGVGEQFEGADLRVRQAGRREASDDRGDATGVVQPGNRAKPGRHERGDTMQMCQHIVLAAVQAALQRTWPGGPLHRPAAAALTATHLRADGPLQVTIDSHVVPHATARSGGRVALPSYAARSPAARISSVSAGETASACQNNSKFRVCTGQSGRAIRSSRRPAEPVLNATASPSATEASNAGPGPPRRSTGFTPSPARVSATARS